MKLQHGPNVAAKLGNFAIDSSGRVREKSAAAVHPIGRPRVWSTGAGAGELTPYVTRSRPRASYYSCLQQCVCPKNVVLGAITRHRQPNKYYCLQGVTV